MGGLQMRYTAILAGLFLCVVVFLTTSSSVRAEASPQLLAAATTSNKQLTGEVVIEAVNAQQQAITAAEIAEAQKPQEHIVARGETLTTVANQYQTTWQRVYAKNTHLSDPNMITVGEKVIIPKADEQLVERAVPVAPPAPVATVKTAVKSKPVQTTGRGSSAGNTYGYGYCTWYAKNRRPDLPNNLGNASTWVSRAAAQGIPTGSVPRAGAIGQRGNHVVYVESVNADGSVNISEMNHAGWNVVSSRTVPGNYFQYVY